MTNRYGVLSFIVLAAIAFAAQPIMAQGGNPWIGPNQLMFTSAPPSFAIVGTPYLYKAQAQSRNTGAVIRYGSDPGNPRGFSIDSVTGVVTWTPATIGWFPCKIVARSNMGETGIQQWLVVVSGGNGIVQGKVTDTAGVGIQWITIEILQASSGDPATGGSYNYSVITDANGKYRISHVNPGKYKLHAVSRTLQYASQWYDGKASATDANVVTVADSPSVTTANFVLRGGSQQLPRINASGKVTDTFLQPIANAQVFFVRSGFALNSNATVDDFRNMFDQTNLDLDFRLEGFSPSVFRTTTDALGKYKLALPPDQYIAFAQAPDFEVEYYKDQSSVVTANRLPLKKDTTNIDFTLAKLPQVVLGSISGTVTDKVKGVGVRSRIIATRDRWLAMDPFSMARAYTTDTDTLGAYTLKNLLPGSYFVLALPIGNYAPAYYTNDTASIRWRRASRVDVNGNKVNGINISVRQLPVAMRGFAGIMGRIRMNAGDPALTAGTFVYAVRNDEVAGYGIADETGQYTIDGLAPGTYSVTADLLGYETTETKTAAVSYSGTGSPEYAQADLNLATVTDVGENAITHPGEFTLSQNYPNPFNPKTLVSFELPVASQVRLVVYNLIGQEVAELVNAVLSPGAHSVSFDASGLGSGVYLYQLSAGTLTATKKMVLLK